MRKGERFLPGFASVILVAATFLLYSPTLTFDFVNWDDDVYVYENLRSTAPSLESAVWFFTHSYFNSYTPLTMLTHMMDLALWEFRPAGHHLTNVVLHACNTFWVFVLCIQVMRILRRSTEGNQHSREILFVAVIAAALFAWHPLRVESVAWISDRKDLLCLFFLLPSTMAYLRFAGRTGETQRRRWYAISFVLFLLACLSKSIAVTFPGILLLADFFLLKRERAQTASVLKEKIPFVLVSIALSTMAINVSPPISSSDMFNVFSSLQRMLLPFSNIIFYLTKTILPLHLSPIYPMETETTMVLYFAGFLAISASVLVLAGKRMKLPLVAWASYVILLLPSSVVLHVVTQTTADRYTYLPAVVVSLFMGGLILLIIERYPGNLPRRSFAITLAVVIGFFAFTNLRQQKIWANSETLWSRAILLYPTMPLPHNNLGLALQVKGDLHGAKAEYARAIKMKPDYVEAHVNLGIVLFLEADWKEAERLFHRAAELAPNRGEVYNNLGIVADAQGNTLDALSWFRKSVTFDPNYAQGHANLGALYEKMGNTAAAYDAYRNAALLGHRGAQEKLKREKAGW